MVMARDDSHAMSGEAVMLLGDLKLSDLAGDDLPDPGPRAMEIVADHGAPSDARISAIHACVARRQKSIVPELRLIAADPQCNIIERRAAIHAIGQLGETSDKKLLESMIPSNPLLVPAITPAIAKLSELD